MHKLTDEMIEEAKKITKYQTGDGHHEHPDCIRIAYEWLDAQSRTKSAAKHTALKHIIEHWGQRYVSASDVEVAATLHGLKGSYPKYNISNRFTRPIESRLTNISEAYKHKKNEAYMLSPYSRKELA